MAFIESVRRSGRSRNNINSAINITPLVDVMLVLLIIFMVSAPLLVNGVPLDLPKTQASNLNANPTSITLSLDGKGNFYLEKEAFSNAQQLIDKLNSKVDIEHKAMQQIFVRGDKKASYQSILEFLALLQQNNFVKISLLSLAP